VPNASFSDVFLRSIKPPETGQVDYWDESFAGGCFGCRVSQGGAKTFILKKDNRRHALGRFPHVPLAKAREAARLLLAERTLGKVRPHAISYAVAVEHFIEEKKRGRRPRTYIEYERLLARLSFRSALCDITHQEAHWQLSRIQAPSEYSHCLVVAKVFFNWCRNRHYIDRNPFEGLSQNDKTTRHRVLTGDELKRVWQAADEFGAFGIIVKLLILTGQRRGEIAALRPEFFKDGICTLPDTLTKNKRQHSFPVGALCAAILPSLQGRERTALLFPARGAPERVFNGWSKSKKKLDQLSGVRDWTLHDLRRTFATNLAALAVPPHITERLLNHATGTISGVAAIYNRFQYMDEMRAAIALWEERLASLLAQHAPADLPPPDAP
jgi:integrase